MTWEKVVTNFGPLVDVTPEPDPPSEPKQPRVWIAGLEVGTKVRDCDGDIWTREKDGSWRMNSRSGIEITQSWEYVREFAPLTEVID